MRRDDDEYEPFRKERWFRRRWFILMVAAAVLAGGVSVATAANAFGENVRGTVTCANGSVSGVFIEADRLPRAWPTDHEFQSGFAHWNAAGPVSAEFDYWLPFGGAYSIHFGCGRLQSAAWATENRTPSVRGTGQRWVCDNQVNTSLATIVVTACRSY